MRPLIARMFTPAQGQLTDMSHYSPAQLANGEAQGVATSVAPSAQTALPAPPRENMIDVSRIEGQVRESSIKKVGEVVQSHPEEALAIIRTWLHEPA